MKPRSGKVEQALRQTEGLHRLLETYKTIFETTATAAIMMEEDTTISLANAEFEKLSGYAKEDVVGKKSWREFVAEDHLEPM